MGCCGSICYDKYSDLKKYPNLYRAATMSQTVHKQYICTTYVKKLTTRAQQNQAKDNPKSSAGLKEILSPPYSNVDRITDNVYLTGVGGLVRENILSLKTTCIINVTFEAPNYAIDGIESIRVPVDDSTEDDLSPYMDEVADKLQDVTQHKGIAIVHCVAGISRSCTLVLAYLIKHKQMSLKEAFLHCKSRRDMSQPNPSFFQQLIDFERKVRGNTSVRIVTKRLEGMEGQDIKVPDFYEKDFPEKVLSTALESKEFKPKKNTLMHELSERSLL